MSRPSLLALLLVLVGGIIALWQYQTESTILDLPDIDAVTVSADGTLVISGTLAPDCAIPLQSETIRFPHNLDIQLHRQRSSMASCGLQAARFAIKLAAESMSETPQVIINDEVWARNESQPSSYELLTLFPVHIEQASLARHPDEIGALQLSLRGAQAVGCDLPELFSLRAADGRVLIGVFNAVSAEVNCPDILAEVDQTVNLPATELAADTLFAVNTFPIDSMETQNVNDSDKVLTHIFRVDANVTNSAPAQISLQVEGEHPDGCDLPVHVAQRRDGATVNVEVYRMVPADMICPMILRPYQAAIALDGDFAAGSYTIKVNAHSQTLDI